MRRPTWCEYAVSEFEKALLENALEETTMVDIVCIIRASSRLITRSRDVNPLQTVCLDIPLSKLLGDRFWSFSVVALNVIEILKKLFGRRPHAEALKLFKYLFAFDSCLLAQDKRVLNPLQMVQTQRRHRMSRRFYRFELESELYRHSLLGVTWFQRSVDNC